MKKRLLFKSLIGALTGGCIGFSLSKFISESCTDPSWLILTFLAIAVFLINLFSKIED